MEGWVEVVKVLVEISTEKILPTYTYDGLLYVLLNVPRG